MAVEHSRCITTAKQCTNLAFKAAVCIIWQTAAYFVKIHTVNSNPNWNFIAHTHHGIGRLTLTITSIFKKNQDLGTVQVQHHGNS